ncbi:alpha/beta hydrolase [Bradyrhizobium sp. 200]|uniref:alpha/beta hydrolase family protein n=1 Tax=Bradyrhizobium sp. 200 TaxID=2782665 RepID=UPI001FFEB71E|nr:alpha/beta hydrolase [Bradyrhizobium sp. 200]UPJ47860.1 alpha/beta hydrolase [Bradyrhizobium sp. 200]
MEYAAWPQVRGDLSSARRAAAAFLDNLTFEDRSGAADRQNWVARWTGIGDEHGVLGDRNIRSGALHEAIEAWLCALTAFEVARRLVDEDDQQSADASARLEAGIQRFELSLEQKVERVQIECCDQTEFLAYYLPAGSPDLCAPAVICISGEQESGTTLLGRLLPVVFGRGISLLVISHDDISNCSRSPSDIVLSCCLDYLSARSDVDGTRIGVYGEGFSAVLATDFAASDRRVAAAVCDGGLWNWTRILASVSWITKAADVVDEGLASVRRSQLIRRLRCPVLVVAGGRGIVSVSEAIKLQADCMAATIGIELVIPRMIRTPEGEVENFVTSDDCIFRWLEQQLARK